MGETTKIEWCHHTFNPWIGCTKVAPECANCYAEELMAKRWKKVGWGDKAPRERTATWRDPVKWNRAAEKAGERRRVFCASLSDIFEDKPELAEWREELFTLIDATPWLDWLLLTKRPENIEHFWPYHGNAFRKNVWLGTSCGHPESVHRVRSLVECRGLAPVLFVSAEPLLQPLDFGPLMKSIDWVIVGGESGQGARPCDLAWIRSAVSQRRAAGEPVFVKQLGASVRMSFDEWNDLTEGGNVGSPKFAHNDPSRTFGIWTPADKKGGDPSEWPADLRVREFPEAQPLPCNCGRPAPSIMEHGGLWDIQCICGWGVSNQMSRESAIEKWNNRKLELR